MVPRNITEVILAISKMSLLTIQKNTNVHM